MLASVFQILFYTPEIPGNTGNAIRLAAVTGAHLHLVEPLGFDLEDAKLRRAGLDYHDLTHLSVYQNLAEAWEALRPTNVYAFSSHGVTHFTNVEFQPGDVLLFGPESVGLPEDVMADERVTATVRIPMLPGLRSLNLANSASIVVYEAWRQNGFAGAEL